MLLKMKRKISLSFFCHSLEIQVVLLQSFSFPLKYLVASVWNLRSSSSSDWPPNLSSPCLLQAHSSWPGLSRSLLVQREILLLLAAKTLLEQIWLGTRPHSPACMPEPCSMGCPALPCCAREVCVYPVTLAWTSGAGSLSQHSPLHRAESQGGCMAALLYAGAGKQGAARKVLLGALRGQWEAAVILRSEPGEGSRCEQEESPLLLGKSLKLDLAQVAQRPALAGVQAAAWEGQNKKDRWDDGLGTRHRELAYSGKSERCRPALTQHHPFDASESPSRDKSAGISASGRESCQFLQEHHGLRLCLI